MPNDTITIKNMKDMLESEVLLEVKLELTKDRRVLAQDLEKLRKQIGYFWSASTSPIWDMIYTEGFGILWDVSSFLESSNFLQ